MTEKDIQNSILKWLAAMRIFAWQNDSVGVYDPVKKIYRKRPKYAINGVSDILGIHRGKFFCIEVKHKTNATQSQIDFLTKVNMSGGLAFIARSIDDVIATFSREGLI